MTPAAPLALLLCLLPLSTRAPLQDTAPVAAPTLVVEDLAGGLSRRPLAGLDLTSAAESGGALLRFEGVETPASPEAGEELARVELLDGGAVLGRLLGGDGELLELGLVGGTTLRVALEELAALRVEARYPEAWTEPVVAAPAGDRLYRRSGPGLDRIDGTVEELSVEGVTLDTALGTKTFGWSEVAALFVEPLEDEPLLPEGERVVVDLVDGGRLRLGVERLTAAGLDGRTATGRRLRLLPGAIAEVLVEGAGLAFLSDLEPREAPPTSPFGDDLGMVWPARRDRCTTGGPLRAGGRRHTRGLGVHAPSRVVYDLGGAWSSLRAEVAVDDSVVPLPARGSVRFRVLADGELRWESEVLHAGDPPRAVPPLDLAGVEELVLEVDPVDELHVGDRADWLRPVLVR